MVRMRSGRRLNDEFLEHVIGIGVEFDWILADDVPDLLGSL